MLSQYQLLLLVWVSASLIFESAYSWERAPSIDLAEIEEQWNDEDDEDSISIDDEIYLESQRRKEKALAKMYGTHRNSRDHMNPNSHSSSMYEDEIDINWSNAMQKVDNIDKPSMIFAKINLGAWIQLQLQRSKEWEFIGDESGLDDLAYICEEYQQDLSWVLVESASCYPIDPDSLLFTTRRGWEGEDVWKYLSQKEEVEELKWNGKIAHPRRELMRSLHHEPIAILR